MVAPRSPTNRPTNSFSLSSSTAMVLLPSCGGPCTEPTFGRGRCAGVAAVLQRDGHPVLLGEGPGLARRAERGAAVAQRGRGVGVDQPGRDQHRDPLQPPRGGQQGREHGAGPGRVAGLQPRAGDATGRRRRRAARRRRAGPRSRRASARPRPARPDRPVASASGARQRSRYASAPSGPALGRGRRVSSRGRAAAVTELEQRAGQQRVRGGGRTSDAAAPARQRDRRRDRAAAPGRAVPAAGPPSPGGRANHDVVQRIAAAAADRPRPRRSGARASSQPAAAIAGKADSNTVHCSSSRSPRRRSSGSSSSSTSAQRRRPRRGRRGRSSARPARRPARGPIAGCRGRRRPRAARARAASVNRSRLLGSTASQASRSGLQAARSPSDSAIRRPVLQAAGGLAGGRAERTQRVAAELAQRQHLEAAVAGLRGAVGQPGPEVAHRRAGTAPRTSRARPRARRRAAQQLGSPGPLGGVQGAGEQRLGVGGGEPRQWPAPPASRTARAAPGQSPAAAACRRPPRAAPASRSAARRWWAQPGRRRGGGVEHLLDQVVGELVAARSATRQQPRRGGPLAALGRRVRPARPSIAATTAGSTVAPSTAPARSSSSAAGPTRRSRASTAACSDSGAPGLAGGEPAQGLDDEQRCARGSGAGSSRRARPGRRRRPAGPPRLGGSGPRSSRSATSASASSASARPPRRAAWPARAAAPGRRAGPGSAAARRWPGRRCAGRRAAAASARSAASPRSTAGDGLEGPPDLDLRRCRARRRGPERAGELGHTGRRARPRAARPASRSRAAGSAGERPESSASTSGCRNSERSPGVAAGAQHPPPVASTVSASSAASRVLPMPPSPATSSSVGRPGCRRGPGRGEPAQLGGAARPGPDRSGRRRGRCVQGRCRRPFQSGRSRRAPPGARPGLRRRIDAQLVGQRRAQPLEHGQRPGRLASGLVRGHQQAVRRLVEPVGAHRGLRRLRGTGGVAGAAAGPRPWRAGRRGAARRARPAGRPPSRRPDRRPEPGRRRAAAQARRPGRRGDRSLTAGEPGSALGEQQRGLVQVDADGGRVAEAVPGRTAEHDSGPSAARRRLTRVATSRSGRRGRCPVQSTSTMRSVGTTRPRETASRASSRRALRLPTATWSGKPPHVTAKVPASRTVTPSTQGG